MIYTVTFNPALDYVVQLGEFNSCGINRTSAEAVYPGGKGNNVAVVASNLGIKSKALGFKAGIMGDAMEQMLKSFGCDTDFITLDEGETRINVKVKASEEFEINGQGPEIPDEKQQKLFDQIDQLTEEDILVLSGSIPNTLPDSVYEQIMKRLEGRNIRIVVDAAGKLLLNTLAYRPFLVKPNNYELEAFFMECLDSEEKIVKAAKKLQKMGAENVLVSMAEKGAVLVDGKGNTYKALPPKGTVVNSVGAGDSMVAGFIAGYLREENYEAALRLGTAAGSATAFTSWLAGREEIESLLAEVRTERLEENIAI